MAAGMIRLPMLKTPRITETDQIRPSYVADTSLLRELLGEPKVSLDEGITEIALHLHDNTSSSRRQAVFRQSRAET